MAMATGSTTPPPSPSALRRVIVGSLIGTTIEWYDFFLDGTVAALACFLLAQQIKSGRASRAPRPRAAVLHPFAGTPFDWKPNMKIYWIKAQAPLRVLALIKHLGIAAETIEVGLMAGGLKTPAYAALNPNMKAPTLVDGDLVLWEASAIMAHLCIKTGSDMWPAHNPAEQVEVLRWLSWNDNHWSPAVAPFYFEHIVKTTFGFAEPDLASLPAKIPELTRYAKVLDAHLEGRTWVACERLTIADFQLASMATYWRRADMPFAALPNIVRWLEGLARIPAWTDPWPVKTIENA